MARLQDFNSVTPATSDKLLIVEAQGQGLATLNAVGQKVATETTMPSLTTTSKNLVGAVNEMNSGKANISSLATVATSGSYNDLTNKPDIITNYVRVGMGNAPFNLNDCVNGCVYWCNNTGGGTTYTNAPGSSAYHIYTFKPIATHGFQMAVQHNGNLIYVRTLSDNVWGAWKYMALS